MVGDGCTTLGVAASFMAEPLAEALDFWWARLALPVQVRYAPLNQVFQQLLDPASLLAGCAHAAVLVRWEDLAGAAPDRAAVERAAAELGRALAAYGRPLIAIVAEPSPAFRDALGAEFLAAVDAALAAGPRVTVVGPAQLSRLYPVAELHDPYGARAGAVPYRAPYYTALATALARDAARRVRAPYKVLALDCDNTLWHGTCAEDGAAAVVPRPALQERVAGLAAAGMLVCLVSKNEPADVHAVFAAQPGMPLSRAQVVAERISWAPKSASLRSLAAELGIGLDRFVMLDDSPLECAEVRAGCPEVLTLPVPTADAALALFLDHLWALDRGPATAEDLRRVESYREQQARDALARQAPSLEAFLSELELVVDIEALAPAHVARVAQLSVRTTQFNFTGRQYGEAELSDRLARGEVEGLVAHVRDRFGDYGLVGAIVWVPGKVTEVESFFLSCRALSRGVEHRMLAELGRRTAGMLRLRCRPTARNSPARAFVSEVLAERLIDNGGELPAAEAAAIAYRPAVRAAAAPEASAPATRALPDEAIARELCDVGRIHAAVQACRTVAAPMITGESAATATETALVAIFARAFGVPAVGRGDDFFALGGDSLLAICVLSAVADELGVELPLDALHEAPTPAALAAHVDELARGAVPGEQPAGGVGGEDRYAPFPLTDLQQAYWVGRTGALPLGQVGTHVYHEIDFQGLDVDRYRAAWDATIARHDMLRAVILPGGEQRVLEEVPALPLPVLDLSNAGDVEAVLEARRRESAERVLPVDRWPAFDVAATRLPAGTVRVHLSFDAIVLDLWSQRAVLAEVARRYDAPDAPSDAPALSFRAHVLERAAARSSSRSARARAYWHERLEELPAAPELPLARNPASVARSRFKRRSMEFPRAAWERVKRELAAQSATPSGFLLAAFSEVLAAYSRSPRFTVNLTVFDRPAGARAAETLGAFTSVTLVEVDAHGASGFRDRLRLLQERLWRDLDHREVSGIELMRELARRRGVPPAMPVVFTSTLGLGVPPAEAAPAGVRATDVYSATQTPQVWLDHRVVERDGALTLVWDVVEELFPDGLLDAMWVSYRRLIEAFADQPAAWEEGALPLLGAEQVAARVAANATAAPVPDALLHALFEQQVARDAVRTAVVAPGRTMTYDELARLSRRLGRALRARGVRPGTLVGVAIPKSWEQVVAVLGVLQAGAAYLPLDPALPRERLWKLARHGETAVVLTRAGADLTWPPEVTTLEVSESALGAFDDAPLAPAQTPDDLAYVIYTSGSTGEPKGVMVDHRAAANTIQDLNARFEVGPGDRVLALASLSFDLSVYDIFGLLAAGGTIVVPDRSAFPDPRAWAGLLARERVTLWNSVPAQMEMLLSAGEGVLPESLRLVMLSGDWIATSLPGRLRAARPGVRVISMGGATEAAIWSIWHDAVEVDPAWPSIPYGKPLANQTWQVLDARMAPRPTWVPGELYIGGRGLARGYWRDPVRTAERFVVDARTGERLYRTGDLGRYHPDGTLEFLGREDFQLKIHGYRIEPGEIEAALTAHAAVRTALVTADGEPRGARRLVAYVAARDLTADELRRHLAGRLPAYMVPAAIHVLDAFPVTSNGKVDRQALGRLAAAAPVAPAAAPASPLVTAIAGRIAALLGVPAVDPADSFIALGGDSLMGMRLLAGLREDHGVELPFALLFDGAGAAALAAEVERQALSAA